MLSALAYMMAYTPGIRAEPGKQIFAVCCLLTCAVACAIQVETPFNVVLLLDIVA